MSEKSVQVIDRAFDILEALAVEKDGLGVTELGGLTGLHKSTVHRILSAMAERGYVEKNPARGVYKIGLKLVEISSVCLNNVELKTEARPYLSELTAKLNQPTHIAILDGTDAVYIDKVDIVNSIRLYSQIGRRISAHSSALGKCLLSGLTDSELEERLEGYNFTKYTGKTITGKEELIRQVKAARDTGWAIDDEEHDEGIRCIGSPVFDYRGKVIAAVSIAGPAEVISPARDGEVSRLVIGAALNISRRMGFKV